MRTILFILLLVANTLSAQAEIVRDCEGEITINLLAEPWENNTRIFANGNVRIAVLDYWDPANAAFLLAVMYLPNDYIEAEGRACKVVSAGGIGDGYNMLSLDGLKASYDPTRGLALMIDAEKYDYDAGRAIPGTVTVVINRATSQVQASFR